MTNKKCIPLEIVNELSNKYNNCWEIIENIFIKGKQEKDLDWMDYCYIPIGACISIISMGGKKDTLSFSMVEDAALMAAAAPWRIHKQMYNFHPAMEHLLFEQADDIILPIEVLYNLPYKSIYIETTTLDGLNGFFCHFESDPYNKSEEFRLLLVRDDLTIIPIALHLKQNITISESINEMIKESKRNANNMGRFAQKLLKKSMNDMDAIFSVSCLLMQLVLYICSENGEIKEDPIQKGITKIPKSTIYIKDKYKEIRKWNCGQETATIIEANFNFRNKTYKYTDTASTETTKIPHSRRGHWHHYWTGEKNSSNRKLVLKWVAPTFIHPEAMAKNNIIKLNQIENTDNQ